MPILLPCVVKRLSQQEFRQLDYQVMGIAFEMQNDLGRHLDESIYEAELFHRLRAKGLSVWRQFPITMQHGDFVATLAADLLVADSSVYELKAVERLAPAHRSQALTYVLTTETGHGKLVNFGGPKVEGEYVSTSLTHSERRQIQVDDRRWGNTTLAHQLQSMTLDLLADWGMFLDCSLYRAALVHFLGGIAAVRRWIPLYLGERLIGEQECDVVEEDSLLVVSAYKDQVNAERHYQQFLCLTRQKFLHWINLHKQLVTFVTLGNAV
jgi:GxxExxY protein